LTLGSLVLCAEGEGKTRKIPIILEIWRAGDILAIERVCHKAGIIEIL
jgi:hypothetical protein